MNAPSGRLPVPASRPRASAPPRPSGSAPAQSPPAARPAAPPRRLWSSNAHPPAPSTETHQDIVVKGRMKVGARKTTDTTSWSRTERPLSRVIVMGLVKRQRHGWAGSVGHHFAVLHAELRDVILRHRQQLRVPIQLRLPRHTANNSARYLEQTRSERSDARLEISS